MAEPSDLETRVITFFAAAESGDWDLFRSLLADDGPFEQHSAHRGPESADELTAASRGLVGSDLDLTYSNFRRTALENVVIDRHEVRLTRPDGKTGSTDVCVIFEFDDSSRISRIDEYLDTAAFAHLFQP